MKIKSIEGENFKGHESLVLPLDEKIQVFVGANGSGKTSAIQMVKYAITGEEPDDAVNEAYTYMNVSTVLESGTKFERGRFSNKARIKVNGKTATGKMLNDLIETETGIPMSVMKVVSSSEVVENLKPDQFGDFIMKYIPEELDIDSVLKFADIKDPNTRDLLSKLFPTSPQTFGMDMIDAAYDEAYEIRKNLRAIISEKKNNLKNFPEIAPTRSLKDIEAEIEAIAKEEGAANAAKNALKIYNNALESYKKQEVEINALKSEIAAINVNRPNPAKRKELLEKEAEVNNDVLSDKQILEKIRENKLIYETQLKDLECDQCPLCDAIKCTTDKKKYKDEFQAYVESAIEGIEIQEARLKRDEERLSEVKRDIEEYSNLVNLYNKKILLLQQLDRLEKTKTKIPAKPVEVDELDNKQLKKELIEERNKIIEYERLLKIKDELAEYEAQLIQYDEITSALSPKGKVMTEIIQYYLHVFEDICNVKAKNLKAGFSIKFVPENGVKIFCNNSKTKNPVPYKTLSAGEKELVMFLIIDMLNSLSGLRILIMDDLDRLDQDAFESLMKIITDKDTLNDYDHILLCAVDHIDTMDVLKKYPVKINNLK